MCMTGYKSDMMYGRTVTYTKQNGKVWARVPSITRQFLGVGKTKAAAKKDVEKFFQSYPKWKK